MCTESEKQLNLGNLVFDEENRERKSWKSFGRTCNRSLLVFVCQFSDLTLHYEGERSLEASCLCQLYFEQFQSLGRFYVC